MHEESMTGVKGWNPGLLLLRVVPGALDFGGMPPPAYCPSFFSEIPAILIAECPPLERSRGTCNPGCLLPGQALNPAFGIAWLLAKNAMRAELEERQKAKMQIFHQCPPYWGTEVYSLLPQDLLPPDCTGLGLYFIKLTFKSIVD